MNAQLENFNSNFKDTNIIHFRSGGSTHSQPIQPGQFISGKFEQFLKCIKTYFSHECHQSILIYVWYWIKIIFWPRVSLKIPQNVIGRWALGMILKQRKISITRCRFKVSRHRNCIFQSGYDLVERGTLVVGSKQWALKSKRKIWQRTKGCEAGTS